MWLNLKIHVRCTHTNTETHIILIHTEYLYVNTHKHTFRIFTDPSRVCWTVQLTHKTPAYLLYGPPGSVVPQSTPKPL